ncbi:MAG: sigma-70 family RNA polymerase sigma factor [Gemmataceae bacterium]
MRTKAMHSGGSKTASAKTRTSRRAPRAIEALISQFMPFIRLLAGSMLDRANRSWVDSEDIGQSIGYRVVERLRDGRLALMSEGEFKSLLRTMVRNLVLDKQRRRSPMPASNVRPAEDDADIVESAAASAETPSQEIASADATAFLLSRIERSLQPDEYYCFRKHYLEGVDYTELAKQFAVTPDSIRMRLNRALAKVRDVLPNWERWLDS